MDMKTYKLFGASVVALMLSSPAFAQTAPQTTTPQASEEESTESSDIIVTASKREQTLQEVPISVSVTTAESIERSQIRDLIDLQTLVPSLKVGQLQSSANTNFIIRGFGNGANNAGIEPSVGVFIDGVYRSRSAAQIGDLPNIKRVEVLRGPQSTLFGKNASAGIISIVTQEPQFKFGGNVEASYGNFNAIVVKGSVTGPVSETIAVSLAGSYNKRDGYVRDLFLNEDVNNRNRYGVRGQILFEPNSDLKFRLIADYDSIDEACCSVANIFNGPTGAVIQGLAGGRGLVANSPNAYTTFSNFLPVNDITNYGVSLQGDYSVGAFSLTSITAYRKVDSFTDQDVDFSGADLIGRNSADLKIDTFTQELRLASDFDGPFNFLIGGFYFNEKVNQRAILSYGTQFRLFGDQLVRAASGGALNVVTLENTFGALEGAPTRYAGTFFRTGDGQDQRYRLTDESISVFGTADFEIVDGLTLTGGLNYTKDKKRFAINIGSTDVFAGRDLDAPQYAPFRNTLLFQGALAQTVGGALGLGRSATAAEIGAFAGANMAAFAQISAGSQAFANANQNNPAANPLAGLRPLQFSPAVTGIPNAVEPGTTDDSNVSYTARLAYKLSSNLNAYATYATGFKASSVNLSRDSRPSPGDLVRIRTAGIASVNLISGSRFAGPEEATVYEVGLKGNFRGFGFNLAVFQQSLKGFQSNVFQGTGFVLGNAEKQTTKGFEIDATLSPVKNLVFTGSLTYLDSKYDLFTNGSAFNPATNTVGAANLTGRRPTGTPEYSIAVGGTYTAELGGDSELIFHLDYQVDSAFVIAQGLPFKAAPETLNASVSFALGNGLEVTAWGRNLTEPKYNPVIFPSVAQGGSLSGYPSGPRTYGVSAKFKF
jgi:iron complex outermembrane recepter protein